MYCNLEGLRKRGRPRTSYLENIKVWTNTNKAVDIYNAKGQMGNQAAPGDAD